MLWTAKTVETKKVGYTKKTSLIKLFIIEGIKSKLLGY